eukprot:3862611-Rhodomonas_salina.1
MCYAICYDVSYAMRYAVGGAALHCASATCYAISARIDPTPSTTLPWCSEISPPPVWHKILPTGGGSYLGTPHCLRCEAARNLLCCILYYTLHYILHYFLRYLLCYLLCYLLRYLLRTVQSTAYGDNRAKPGVVGPGAAGTIGPYAISVPHSRSAIRYLSTALAYHHTLSQYRTRVSLYAMPVPHIA